MNNMRDRVIVQGESNIEIIKHRIYEVQGYAVEITICDFKFRDG